MWWIIAQVKPNKMSWPIQLPANAWNVL